jgi:RNA polymerase sigma-70 factor (ECF subfamily)
MNPTEQTLTDEDLVQRAGDGSEAAFDNLVDRYTPIVFRIAFGITGTREEAEDVVQETFLSVFKNLDNFAPSRAAFKTWILTIARNNSINKFKYLKRRAAKLFSEFSTEEPEQVLSDHLSSFGQADAETMLASKQEFHLVETAFRKLPERQRTALMLKAWEGLSYAEISEVMNISVSAVESLIFRARKQLMGMLEDQK